MARSDEFLVYICCIVLWTQLSESQSLQEYGVVYSNSKPFLFVGENMDIYCNITNKDVRENSSMLHFERSTRNGQEIVPAEYIDTLTTKAVRLRLRNVALDDDGVYTCFQETFSGESRVMGSQAVKIDNKPQSVKDIACRVHNWNHMKCTWSLGVKYQHPEYIKVSLVWTIHGEQQDCPKMTSTSCLWDSKVYKHGYLYLMVVEVATIVESKELVHARSPQFKIDTVLFVEPAPVNNLQATVESSTCVYLTWQHSSDDWLKFFVAESRVKGKEKWNQIILNQEQQLEDYQSDVCGLIPFTDYEFRMSVLPFPVETSEPVVQGFKSEWKTVSAKTLEDVPTAAPHICTGCFHDLKCSNKESHRCVRLYWQSLKEHEKCGILTSYNITYTNTDTGVTYTSLLPVTKSSSQLSVDLELPSLSQSYKVFITPGTSQGFSKSSSSLYLQSVVKKPNPPTSFLVEWDEVDMEENIKFYLSWAALNVDSRTGMKYSNVSVVWCCGRRQTSECENDLNWISLQSDHVTYELQPEEDCFHNDYLIGVTTEVLYDGVSVSSGIQWSSCAYLRNQKPQKSLKNVHQSTIHPTNGLTIQWERSLCQEEEGFITEYLVAYCPLYEDNTCMESEKFLNVSNTAAEVTLNHLKEDIRYKVNVIAVSSAGLGPYNSIITQPVKGSPLPEPEVDRSVGIIVGVVSFFIFLGIIVALWRYCFYLKKKVSNTETLIQPYAQTSESILGSEDAKNKRLSKTCSDYSVASQSNLLLKLMRTSQNQLTKKARSKRNSKKDMESKVFKEKNCHLKESKALLDRNSSMSSNDSHYVNEIRKPHSKRASSLICNSSALITNISNISKAPNSEPTNLLTSANIIQPSFTKFSPCQHKLITDLTNEPEVNDPCIINFSKTSTLSLRRHSVGQAYFLPLTLQEQHVDLYASSVPENHEMTVGFVQGLPCAKYTQNNSFCTCKYQQPYYCLASATNETVKYHNSAPASECIIPSDYMVHSNTYSGRARFHSQGSSPYDYSRNSEIHERRRHGTPHEYIHHFQHPVMSPPLTSYDVDGKIITHHTLPHHHHISSGHQCGCHVPIYSKSKNCSFLTVHEADVTNYSQSQQTFPHQIQETLAENFTPTYQNQERLTQPPNCLNISPASGSAVFPDAVPYMRSISNEGLVDNPQTNTVLSSYTFPRKASKDSNILQIPSPLISRPLSGDLLELPPNYYQDPKLDGSHQILTEL